MRPIGDIRHDHRPCVADADGEWPHCACHEDDCETHELAKDITRLEIQLRDAATTERLRIRDRWDRWADWHDAPPEATAAYDAGDMGEFMEWLMEDPT